MGKSPDPPIARSPDGSRPIARLSGALVLPRLYAIIDPAQCGGRPLLEVAEALLAAGIRLIQFRDKQASSRELYEKAQPIAKCVRAAGGTFILNDRADVALAVDADGVHVGQNDLPVEAAREQLGPEKLIGYSTHTLEQVKEAVKTSANYIAVGPIFPTSSKVNPDPQVGLEGLRSVRKVTTRPLVAIGGITLENAAAVLAAGADSVAVIRDLVAVPDIRERAEEFLKQVSLAGVLMTAPGARAWK
jgi:thiamine-phosphate pyrophosphorylase